MPIRPPNCRPAWSRLNATIIVRGPGGERRIAAEEFFTGIYETDLSPQELLVAVELPVARKNSAHFFHEFARRHGDYAIVGLAAQAIVEGWALHRSSARSSLPSAIGRCWPGPPTKLVNVAITPAVLAEASAALDEELDPQDDQQASAAMRRHLAKVLLARCVSALLGRPDLNAGASCVTAPMPISLEVNGERVDAHVLPRLNLADFLREHLQLTGTHVGCEHGVCGACTVRVNGEIVRSCLMLAVQTHGAIGRDHRGIVRQRRDCRSAGRLSRSQRAAVRLLHAGNADGGAGSAEAAGRARTGSRFASIFPAITAAAPATRPLSTRSRPRRGRAWRRRP